MKIKINFHGAILVVFAPPKVVGGIWERCQNEIPPGSAACVWACACNLSLGAPNNEESEAKTNIALKFHTFKWLDIIVHASTGKSFAFRYDFQFLQVNNFPRCFSLWLFASYIYNAKNCGLGSVEKLLAELVCGKSCLFIEPNHDIEMFYRRHTTLLPEKIASERFLQTGRRFATERPPDYRPSWTNKYVCI